MSLPEILPSSGFGAFGQSPSGGCYEMGQSWEGCAARGQLPFRCVGPECSDLPGQSPRLHLPPNQCLRTEAVAQTLPVGTPAGEVALFQAHVTVLGVGRVAKCMCACECVWWGGQRNLDFRREENNVAEGGWITKDFNLQLIVSSCKNTKGEARPGWGLQFLPIPHRPAEWGPAWPLGGGRGDQPRVNIREQGRSLCLPSRNWHGTRARREAARS